MICKGIPYQMASIEGFDVPTSRFFSPTLRPETAKKICYEIFLTENMFQWGRSREGLAAEARDEGEGNACAGRRVEVQRCGSTRGNPWGDSQNSFLAKALVKRIGVWGHRIPFTNHADPHLEKNGFRSSTLSLVICSFVLYL